MAPAPTPSAPVGAKSGTLWTNGRVAIQCSLTSDERHVLVSGQADSLLIPVHGLMTSPVDTGHVAEQVREDHILQADNQIPPGLVGLQEGHTVVVNGLSYEVVEAPSDKYSQEAEEYRLTLRAAG